MWIFTHLKLCLADAIHNFKWVKIIQIWQNGGQLCLNLTGWCHILSWTYFKWGTYCAKKNKNPNICGTGGYRVLNGVKGNGLISHSRGTVIQHMHDRKHIQIRSLFPYIDRAGRGCSSNHLK